MFLLRKVRPGQRAGGNPLVLRSADNTPHAVFSRDVTDSYRRLLTGLTYRGTLPRRLAIVAAMRGEGVTYTTLGLAATLASDMNVRVCAVELNWAWPGMTRQQPVAAARRRPWQRKPADTASGELAGGSGGGPGLAAVLSGAAKLDDALLPTSLPNLRILPAGNAPEAQRPALARSEQLTRCLDELSERFDHLLLDIPAIMVTSDSVAIASRCDACCVVVRQSVTRSTAIRQALDEIKHLTVLGVVLNQTRFHTPRWLLNAIPQE